VADRAVSNASPLIALGQIGQISLLQVAAEVIVVPRAVADEIEAYGTTDPASVAIASTAWITIADAIPIPESIAGWDLGAGESAVLAWALANPGTRAIVDDAEARSCAATVGVAVRGTVGIVLAARLEGRIPLARPVLERLREVGLWISDALLTEALALVGE
jgi:predicted nucleic acid-binding protein